MKKRISQTHQDSIPVFVSQCGGGSYIFVGIDEANCHRHDGRQPLECLKYNTNATTAFQQLLELVDVAEVPALAHADAQFGCRDCDSLPRGSLIMNWRECVNFMR
jgi:hypothetical protein